MTERISKPIAFAMVTVAVIFDLLQFFLALIPLLGEIGEVFISVLAGMTFFIWFMLHFVNYFGGKKAGVKIAAVLGGTIVELVPLVDALPAITVSVIVIILATWAEDRTNHQESLRQMNTLASIAKMKYGRGERAIKERFPQSGTSAQGGELPV